MSDKNEQGRAAVTLAFFEAFARDQEAGESRSLEGTSTLLGLLETLGLEPRCVAVERNKRLVRRSNFDQTDLADGDVLEIVTLVGGG